MSLDRLLEAAKQARSRAYAPYSGYSVGAAVLDESGKVWAGCNVENVAYGSTICAERGAVLAMVAGGGRAIQELLLLTKDGAMPCGACLQVLAEFSPRPSEVRIHVADERGGLRRFTLAELLPLGFRTSEAKRTEL